ncbi:GvpL/GvpF family gas vesicle protein [Streptomyces kanasensis]|uniref:GvpL/GvpF family gas vesicle protein n=1 Tax=Streptomyces kanasensis TaxID=936756 RepID=UPI00382F6BEB
MTNPYVDTLTYVYAVARHTGTAAGSRTGLRGLGGAPVVLLTGPSAAGRSAPLVLAASPVPERDFNERALKKHLEDLEWLEDTARTHNDVVQALALHTTVLPLRLATVYEDDDRARQALAAQHDTFAERIALLDAHMEYGVKIYLKPAAAPAGPGVGSGTAPPVSPGKAYLRQRRAQHTAREAVYEQAQEAAATIEAVASRYASGRVRHPPQRGALTGPAENVLNDAYLVPDGRAAGFRADVEEAVRAFRDIHVEVTGPWAPYSFAMPPSQGDRPVAEQGRTP